MTDSASKVLDIAIEFTAATTRWSTGGSNSLFLTTGTIWYGIMCRSCVLLERLLRSSLVVLSQVSEDLVAESRRRRGAGKPLSAMTMGQCFGVLEELAPALLQVLTASNPGAIFGSELLPEADREAWRRILSLRNRLAHHGPGFLDSVDLFSGRIWREYEIQEPLHEQARDVWRLGRQICKSPVVLTCISLEGVSAADAIDKLAKAESVQLTLREVSTAGNQAINDFHTPSAREVGEPE